MRFRLARLSVLSLMMASGCYQVIKQDGDFDRFARKYGDPRVGTPGDPTDPAGGAVGAAVLLQTFEGPGRSKQASALVRHLQREVKLTDIWFQDIAGITYVYRGRFASASDFMAKKILQDTQRLKVDGVQSFQGAQLVAIGSTPKRIASEDPADLRRYPGMYTLQIGFYDPAFGANYRQAAQQAVQQLRTDGFDAYYYHGPNMSVISIGLFSEDAAYRHDGTVVEYSEAVRKLQEQFPHNLGNGVTLIEKNKKGEVKGEQSSVLVEVPDY